MRRYLRPLITLLALAVTAAALVLTTSGGVRQARALGTFDLGEHDHILAESPGCQVECRIISSVRRTCVIKDFDCKAICMDVPECNVPGRGGMPRVCAIIRQTR